MPSQPATKQDVKELLQDFGHVHAQQFKRIDGRFDTIDHKLTEHDDRFESITDHLTDIDLKLSRLLTDTRVEQLEHRVASLEHALYGDRR
jgi:archaellum component FlaC